MAITQRYKPSHFYHESRHTRSHILPERMLQEIGNAKSWNVTNIKFNTYSYTVVKPDRAMVWTISKPSSDGVIQSTHENLRELITAIEEWPVFRCELYDTTTRTLSYSFKTHLVDIREVLRKCQHDECLSRMSPERRTLYEDMMKLRKEIGRVDIDVSQIVREIREE